MPWELRNPTGLWLLALLAPLIVLYILKVKRQRLRIASTWLWAEARRDLMAKSPFRRLILQVPLVLQILALLLLALGLAQLSSRGQSIVGDHVAIILDTSASMAAREPGGKSRMELARERAQQIIEQLEPGSSVTIIEAGKHARVLSPLDRDRRRLSAAIERARATDIEGKLGPALALAVDRFRQLGGERRIIVITDGASDEPDAPQVALPVDRVVVGQALPNAGIVRIDVRSGMDATRNVEQAQVFTMVANYGDQARDLYVTLRQRNVDAPLASRRITVAPGKRSPVVLSFEPEPGDAGMGLVVELSPPDALTADDRGYARVPMGRKLPVVIAPAKASPWVQRALLADSEVDLYGTSLAELSQQKVERGALVVVEGACPSDLPGGEVLLLNPPAGPCGRAIVGQQLERPLITSWAESDQRFRFLTLDGIHVEKAHAIDTEGPLDPLVRAREGTLISDISTPSRGGTLVAFDVGESNWPLRASFVLFIRNVLERARARRARGTTGHTTTGVPLRLQTPTDVSEVLLEGPQGKESKVPARTGLAVLPEVRHAGFYHVSWQGAQPGSELVAANLTSNQESDLRPRAQKQMGTASAVSNLDPEGALSTWTWLLAAIALLLIAADAWWLSRRPKPLATELQRPLLPTRGAEEVR